jgi:hypothetical protein
MKERDAALETLLRLWCAGIGENDRAKLFRWSGILVRPRQRRRSQQCKQQKTGERATGHGGLHSFAKLPHVAKLPHGARPVTLPDFAAPSGADLTFVTHMAANSHSECRSEAPPRLILASSSSILTSELEPAEPGCECWNRTAI